MATKFFRDIPPGRNTCTGECETEMGCMCMAPPPVAAQEDVDERPPVRPMEAWLFVYFVLAPWAVIWVVIACARGCSA